ncbi:hypothetical protein BJ138DRAFT_1184088 [Hygrophoropsis aurantiaca]|uniref:Uncharacterized protein n=1 Tax=Hygrophoropsis aurantiaca TaxID=72124 RepID=A0ACB7ZTB0_9AGAM|nr:hypothetical protein BJ138DRAFT_1184088 [Hygrophoropsis aurantiaca]
MSRVGENGAELEDAALARETRVREEDGLERGRMEAPIIGFGVIGISVNDTATESRDIDDTDESIQNKISFKKMSMVTKYEALTVRTLRIFAYLLTIGAIFIFVRLIHAVRKAACAGLQAFKLK